MSRRRRPQPRPARHAGGTPLSSCSGWFAAWRPSSPAPWSWPCFSRPARPCRAASLTAPICSWTSACLADTRRETRFLNSCCKLSRRRRWRWLLQTRRREFFRSSAPRSSGRAPLWSMSATTRGCAAISPLFCCTLQPGVLALEILEPWPP